jgi:hypothetical protein
MDQKQLNYGIGDTFVSVADVLSVDRRIPT